MSSSSGPGECDGVTILIATDAGTLVPGTGGYGERDRPKVSGSGS